MTNTNKNINTKLNNNCDKEKQEIEETLYLSNIPGFIEDINNIRKNENWNLAKEFNLDEEW